MDEKHDFDDVLAAAREGASWALTLLWHEFNPRLNRYLAVRAYEHEDVAADVWIDAARNLHRFNGGEDDFRKWLFTIAFGRAIDLQFGQFKRRRFSLSRNPAFRSLLRGWLLWRDNSSELMGRIRNARTRATLRTL